MTNQLILASSSPRRVALLQSAGYTFTQHTRPVDEEFQPNKSPAENAVSLAKKKAFVFQEDMSKDEVILSADTVIALDGEPIGKPKDERDAVDMLSLLSKTPHQVITGVALATTDSVRTFHAETKVTFYPLTDEQIDMYVRTGEPLDKAGGYGINGLAALFIKEIVGDYYNVVGLPLSRLRQELEHVNIYPDWLNSNLKR
ncbi:septum formation protein Maf [Geomicrobium sp. JCM 19037]|uniref:Maf family protein n=1 Tax=unclassified Geomicrobium TaxID=2628951 RepID=UPI00045F19E2|nr:Maf family protein [Geomicrobium sp. JCM 19037]GAK03195.1 septum formation protein Maf [Geomicrobium sp. JCM 19037]